MARVRQGGTDLVRTPKFKPTRDRSVNSIVVACPTCGVEPGKHCIRLDGFGPTASRHPARRRMAVRALNNAQED